MSMQYKEIIKVVKHENFQKKIFDIFLIFARNIDCRYMLDTPRRGGANKYTQSMFWCINKKIKVYPCRPQFFYINKGFKGVYFSWTCFPDDCDSNSTIYGRKPGVLTNIALDGST